MFDLLAKTSVSAKKKKKVLSNSVYLPPSTGTTRTTHGGGAYGCTSLRRVFSCCCTPSPYPLHTAGVHMVKLPPYVEHKLLLPLPAYGSASSAVGFVLLLLRQVYSRNSCDVVSTASSSGFSSRLPHPPSESSDEGGMTCLPSVPAMISCCCFPPDSSRGLCSRLLFQKRRN